MESGKGILFLVVLALILSVVGIAYVVNQSGDESPADPAEAPKPPESVVVKDASLPPPPKVEEVKAEPPVAPEPKPAPEGPKEKAQAKPNPRHIVPPVDEPDMPLDSEKGKKFAYVPLANDTGFVFERWEPVPKEGEAPAKDAQKVQGVVLPGMILMTQGIVELFGCGEGGKTHESILRLDCDVQALDLALTLAGFQRGPLPGKLDLNEAGQGSRVIILVQWIDRDGKLMTQRSEDLVLSNLRGGPMPRVGWTYVARWLEQPDPTSPTGKRKQRILMAAYSKAFITTLRENSALLDNPLAEAIDDTLFQANTVLLPQAGTPVRVILRNVLKSEREEIMAEEKKIREKPMDFRADDRQAGDATPKKK